MTNDDNAPSFKYKANIAGYTGDNGRKNGVNSCTIKIFK